MVAVHTNETRKDIVYCDADSANLLSALESVLRNTSVRARMCSVSTERARLWSLDRVALPYATAFETVLRAGVFSWSTSWPLEAQSNLWQRRDSGSPYQPGKFTSHSRTFLRDCSDTHTTKWLPFHVWGCVKFLSPASGFFMRGLQACRPSRLVALRPHSATTRATSVVIRPVHFQTT